MHSGSCQIRQYGDQTQCAACGLAWDTNDPDPPACRRGLTNKERGRRTLSRLLRDLAKPR